MPVTDSIESRQKEVKKIKSEVIRKAVKPFAEETQSMKTKMILTWILNEEPSEDILNGKKKVQNVTTYLNKMKNNSYLRLFEDVDLTMIKDFMTSTSWILLQDFREKHINDKWICPKCNSFLRTNQKFWQCERCLFWYHEKCLTGHIVKARGNSSEMLLCGVCFFQ